MSMQLVGTVRDLDFLYFLTARSRILIKVDPRAF